VLFRSWIRRRIQRFYFGNLCPEAVILVSGKMDGYLRVTREKAYVATYKKECRVNFETELGTHKVKFGALSALAWKKWAGVAIIPDDLNRLVRRKKLSLEILRAFMRDENPEIRKTVLKLLPRLRKAPGLAETVGEMLNDTDPVICAAALNLCPKIKAGLLHDKVVPLLKHAAHEVRQAASRYFTSFPHPETTAVLATVMPDEQDTRVYKQMKKALRACRKANRSEDSNPYSWR